MFSLIGMGTVWSSKPAVHAGSCVAFVQARYHFPITQSELHQAIHCRYSSQRPVMDMWFGKGFCETTVGTSKMLKGFDLLAYNEFKFNIPLLAIHPSGGGDFESGIDAALEAATRVEDPQWGKNGQGGQTLIISCMWCPFVALYVYKTILCSH